LLLIAEENDTLKLEVQRLEQKVKILEKQAKVRHSQDNCRNMVNKLEKGSNFTKWASQQSNKAQPLKRQQKGIEDEKIKYARMSHIKNGIGYKMGDKHNSRVNTKDKKFIKFTKANVQQEKKQSTKITNNVSHSYANASHISHISYHNFDASYVLMRNKIVKIVALYIGPHHKRPKTCVWVPKVLISNVKWPKQVWVPKNKAWFVFCAPTPPVEEVGC
jgi:hypothetical protein